jgi:hypothetical protein
MQSVSIETRRSDSNIFDGWISSSATVIRAQTAPKASFVFNATLAIQFPAVI